MFGFSWSKSIVVYKRNKEINKENTFTNKNNKKPKLY